MTIAIQINGVTTQNKTVPLGVAVSLLNADLAGVTEQTWQLVAYPERVSPTDETSFTDPDFATNWAGWTVGGDGIVYRTQVGAFPAVTGIPDLPGRWLVRLLTNLNPDPAVNPVTSVFEVTDPADDMDFPAAGESTETGTRRGWSRARNRQGDMVRRRVGWMRVYNGSGGAIAAGKVLRFGGSPDWRTVGGNSVPGGSSTERRRIVSVTVEDGTAAAAQAYDHGIAAAAIADGEFGWAQSAGIYEGNFGAYSVGDRVYVNATGDLSATESMVSIGTVTVANATGAMIANAARSPTFTLPALRVPFGANAGSGLPETDSDYTGSLFRVEISGGNLINLQIDGAYRSGAGPYARVLGEASNLSGSFSYNIEPESGNADSVGVSSWSIRLYSFNNKMEILRGSGANPRTEAVMFRINGTSQIQVGIAGNSTTPGLGHTTATASGLFWDGFTQLGATAGAVEGWRITDNGCTLIGATAEIAASNRFGVRATKTVNSVLERWDGILFDTSTATYTGATSFTQSAFFRVMQPTIAGAAITISHGATMVIEDAPAVSGPTVTNVYPLVVKKTAASGTDRNDALSLWGSMTGFGGEGPLAPFNWGISFRGFDASVPATVTEYASISVDVTKFSALSVVGDLTYRAREHVFSALDGTTFLYKVDSGNGQFLVHAGAGSVAVPHIGQVGNTGTGRQWSAANVMKDVCGSTEIAAWSVDALTMNKPIVHLAGSVGAVSSAGPSDPNTGRYWVAADYVADVHGGTIHSYGFAGVAGFPIVIQIEAGARGNNGAVGAPTYSWSSFTTTGFYAAAGPNVFLSIAGSAVFSWNATDAYSVVILNAEAGIKVGVTSGNLDLSPMSATAHLIKFKATSSTPATTWTAGVPSNNPAKFIKVQDEVPTTYYIPVWT